MKRLIIIFPLILSLLSGCGPTLNQLKGEEAYYAARVAMSKQADSVVLFEMTAKNANKPIVLENVAAIKVFAPPINTNGDSLMPYPHKDYVQPWLNVLSMAVPWLGAWGIVNSTASAMKEMGNSTHMTIAGEGNTGTIAGPVNNTLTGTGHVAGGVVDQTHTPTIVTQPPPLVVIPPVVNPVVVNPVIVTP